MGNRKIILILFASVLIGAGIAGVYWHLHRLRQSEVQLVPSTVETKTVPVAQAPAGLPDNLPIEPGSQVLENYQATTTSDGRVQGTRKFTSKKSLSDAVKVYVDFFAKTGWTVASQKTESTFQSALLRRNDSTILVVVRNDVLPAHNVVEITLTEPQ